jgi:hypothetical protein
MDYIKINLRQSRTILENTFYKAETPPEWNTNIWVSRQYIVNRGKILPTNGEITYFELMPDPSLNNHFLLIPRRNYKVIFISHPGIDKIYDIIECHPELLIISTKIFNSIALIGQKEGRHPGIYIVAKNPKDHIHKTLVITTGNECKAHKIDSKIYFTPRLP